MRIEEIKKEIEKKEKELQILEKHKSIGAATNTRLRILYLKKEFLRKQGKLSDKVSMTLDLEFIGETRLPGYEIIL